MEFQYETIQHDLDLPIRIFTHTLEEFPYHWHDEMEILFLIRGSVEILIDQEVHTLEKGDIFLVNQNEIHFLKSRTPLGESQLLVLQFDLAHFKQYGMNPEELRFRLEQRAYGEIENPGMKRLRQLLAKMMDTVINKKSPYRILVEMYLLELIAVLVNQFPVGAEYRSIEGKKHDRIQEILEYILQNYKNPSLSIEEIGDHFFLNTQYLSRTFGKSMGIPMKKFIENIRLNKSLPELRLSDKRILDIALSHGFPDAKSYYRVFREIMNTTPTDYRNERRVKPEQLKSKGYFSINNSEALSELFEYLVDETGPSIPPRPPESRVHVKLKNTAGEPLTHTWSQLTTFGYGPHGLRKDFFRQMQMLQDAIGFKYVRFHGIFADEFLVYNEKPDGTVYYNFNHVDALLDSLIELNLRPFIEIGFMPGELASKESALFWWKSNVSPPKSLKKWAALIDAFLRHLLNRYGQDEVRKWYFEFWNEPEIENIFWHGTREEFFEFFLCSYRAFRGVDENLRLGGFGTINLYRGEEWHKAFLEFMKKNDLRLDFFTFHVYQMELQPGFQGSIENGRLDELLSEKTPVADAFAGSARIGGPETITKAIDELVEAGRMLGVEEDFWITEWNGTPDCRELTHDTAYMGPFIIKNALQNRKKVKGMGYWTATDLHEEFQLEQPLFHGGFGLMTYNGLKKPSFHGFRFLSELGDEVLAESESLIITRKGLEYRILAWHYCHYNEAYTRLDYSQINETERYRVFQEQSNLDLEIHLQELKGLYEIQTLRVGRKEGSVFDAWVEMGAPKDLTPAGHRALAAKSEPGYLVERVQVEGSLTLRLSMEPHEMVLLTIKAEI